jgi:hypothetical protein
MKENSTRHYLKNREAIREKERLKRIAERQKVLDFYGAYCHCPGCKENHKEFLTIEHLNGGGRAHRKKERVKNIYTWLCRTYPNGNFPDWLTIFCYNCNCSSGHYGYCPHEKELN